MTKSPKFHTKVGAYRIPVRGLYATLILFHSGEHGRKEAGWYAFWTAVLKKPVLTRDGTRRFRKVFGRARVGESAGDRLDRMRFEMNHPAQKPQARQAYRRSWLQVLQQGGNIAYIRPSTISEIRHWMKDHKADAPHASSVVLMNGEYKLWR